MRARGNASPASISSSLSFEGEATGNQTLKDEREAVPRSDFVEHD